MTKLQTDLNHAVLKVLGNVQTVTIGVWHSCASGEGQFHVIITIRYLSNL